jgi:hypothetical protein
MVLHARSETANEIEILVLRHQLYVLQRRTPRPQISWSDRAVIAAHHGAPWDLRRARCGESRPAGSGSGPRKRTGRKTGTAPRTDFTTVTGRTALDQAAPSRPLPRCAQTDIHEI